LLSGRALTDPFRVLLAVERRSKNWPTNSSTALAGRVAQPCGRQGALDENRLTAGKGSEHVFGHEAAVFGDSVVERWPLPL
jgi:hypothetical protein